MYLRLYKILTLLLLLEKNVQNFITGPVSFAFCCEEVHITPFVVMLLRVLFHFLFTNYTLLLGKELAWIFTNSPLWNGPVVNKPRPSTADMNWI